MHNDCIDHGKARGKYGHGKSSKGWCHRLAYAEANGLELWELSGWVVRHTCDNGWCINPTHLVLGTHQDNVQDRVDRDRTARGDSHCNAKLTYHDACVIRARYKPRCRTNGTRALGREYGVHQVTISEIVRGLIWRNP